MDQYLDDRQKEILWDVLANPTDNGAQYAQNLARLVQENPQSGLLQLLYARAADADQLSKAVVYVNPRILHKVVNHAEGLRPVDSQSIVSALKETPLQHHFNSSAEPILHNVQDATISQPAVDDAGSIDPTPVTTDETLITEDPAGNNEQIEAISTANESVKERSHDGHDEPFEEIAEAPFIEINSYQEPPSALLHDGEEALQISPAVPVEEQTANNELLLKTEPEIKVANGAEQQATEVISPTPLPPVYSYGSRFPKPELPPAPAVPEPEPPHTGIEDDVYDEIVGIDDIGFKAATEQTEPAAWQMTEARFSDPDSSDAEAQDDEPSQVLFHQPQPVVEPVQEYDKQVNQEEERLILGGIVNADYLSFDKKLDELRNAAQPLSLIKKEQPRPVTPAAAETHEMSRYDDDKMPYTFLWWLNKTRKEFAGTLQPYATEAREAQAAGAGTVPVPLNKADELQQQYVENIFSLTPVSAIERDADPEPMAFDPGKKEDVIIERFIHTEPQIKPLSADKLDNENKAKKSSEDQNDYVTETLARIYTDQMLYHKAIATYKKLMLKFPQKNIYFAARIEELEKKTN